MFSFWLVYSTYYNILKVYPCYNISEFPFILKMKNIPLYAYIHTTFYFIIYATSGHFWLSIPVVYLSIYLMEFLLKQGYYFKFDMINIHSIKYNLNQLFCFYYVREVYMLQDNYKLSIFSVHKIRFLMIIFPIVFY